jgi:hypothetical protein
VPPQRAATALTASGISLTGSGSFISSPSGAQPKGEAFALPHLLDGEALASLNSSLLLPLLINGIGILHFYERPTCEECHGGSCACRLARPYPPLIQRLRTGVARLSDSPERSSPLIPSWWYDSFLIHVGRVLGN